MACLLAIGLLLPAGSPAASFQQDANGFVVMEAENFDLNVTQPGGQWVFDNAPLTGFIADPFSGWGYMIATGAGGTDTNTPHLDFKVNFTSTGPHYIWINGSDYGSKSLHMGLDGVVPPTATWIGGPDGSFGLQGQGELCWVGTYASGVGYDPAYLNVPSVGEHTVQLFIRQPGLFVDRIVLTTDIGFGPSPSCGGASSGFNVPPQTVAPSPGLTVAVTQPESGKGFPSNSIVTVSAKATTNGPAVTKVEFFSRLLPSGADTKIGEATMLPYKIGWTNPPPGNYTLKAKVTDANSAMATSAVVNATIFVPTACTSPMIWAANNFDTGLGSFTLEVRNHDGSAVVGGDPFDLDWSNSANAGGPAGELGGRVVRLQSVVPYIAEPLIRPVSLNDDLWFRVNMAFFNNSGNSDVFFGYFDTNSFTRLGFHIRNPSSSSGWRFRAQLNPLYSANLTGQIPDTQSGRCEFHWIPSGLGDGSGTITGLVNNVAFGPLTTNANVTFGAFGFLVPSQQADEPNLQFNAWFDTMEYKVPTVLELSAQLLSANKVLVSWAVPGATLQYNDVSIASTNDWVNSADTVVQIGGAYYVTNMIPPAMRWFRLKQNCP